MSRRVQRIIDVSKKKQGYVSQRDMDGSAHRLSKPADKFAANRAVPSEKPEPYCVVYFRNNPDAVDIRPPTEKLEELKNKLDDDLEPSVKFTTLIQIKSAEYMLHGENSAEALRAHAKLGFFYNENLRPQSALRHLEKAHMLERTNTIEPEESIEIAVETAQAHISLKNESKKNTTTRHVAQAEECLRPYYDTEIEDLHLRYKRDLVKARIFAAKKKYNEALELYETALQTLQEEYDNEETPEEAKLYVEMAETAALQNLRKQSGQYYKKAYEIFRSLDMEESAKNIEDKLPDETEFEEDEEDGDGDDDQLYAPHPPDDENDSQISSPNEETTRNPRKHQKALPTEIDAIVDAITEQPNEENNEEEEQENADVVVHEPTNENETNESGTKAEDENQTPEEENQPEDGNQEEPKNEE